MLHTSSTRTRRGWCCLRLYYKIFFIYRTCMRRTPARPVRALCEPVARLLSKNMTCARPRCNATPGKHFLHTSHCTLHTPHLTLALHSPRFISSQIMWTLLNSSHLTSSLLTCHLDKFFSTVFIQSGHWSTLLIFSKFFSTRLSCSAGKKALTVREKSLAQKTLSAESFCTQNLETQLHLHRKAFTKYFVLQSLHKALPVLLCATKLAQSASQYYLVLQSLRFALQTKHAQSRTSRYYFVLQSLRKARTSTTLCYKLCTLHVPVLLCTTKFAQSTSPVLLCTTKLAQALPRTTLYYKSCTNKARPSTTLYYKTCTKHFPVLLRTTELTQNTFQYYVVLQSLHKLLPSINVYYKSLQKVLPSLTLYYKVCTKNVPVLLCTTKLAQTTSQYYCVLQSLRKTRSSTTLYCTACTNYFPVILCTTKLAQTTS